jgi:hypothetical protein
LDERETLRLNFEGVIAFPASDPGEAVHFFEHTLGLEPAGEDGPLRFYSLGSELALAIDASGDVGDITEPYLVFSAGDLAVAAEHFLQRGCHVRELSWAQGAGFLARSPEGRVVCVVEEAALGE